MPEPTRGTKRLIGVLGGMGPAATVDFLAKLVALTPAETDQEHVPLLVHSVPQIPDRVDAIARGSDAPFGPMRAGIRLLEQAGAEAIVIPCNTAHVWYDRLAAASTVPIIHIAQAVRQEIEDAGRPVNRLAILATRATLGAQIFQDRLAGAVESFLVPDEPSQVLLDQAIAAVKRNDRHAAQAAAGTAVQALLSAGADGLLIACTELPLALAGNSAASASFDATAALARACIAASLGTRPVLALDRGRPHARADAHA